MTPWRGLPQSGAPFVLRNATVPAALAGMPSREDLLRVDIGVADGRIRFVAPAEAETPCDWHEAEIAGAMVWPCFVEAHTHLDTTQIWTRSPNPDGTFDAGASAIIADRESHWTPDDMRARMEFGLRCAHAHGLRAMRTHIGSQNDQLEQRWEIFRDLRDSWAGRIALQAVPLVSTEALGDDDVLARVIGVVRKSDGVLGAFAPMSGNIEAQLARIFDAAERHDLALDFHADETAAPTAQSLLAIARLAGARRFARPIQVGHACSLAMQPPALIEETLDLVAEAGLHIVTLPSCNLYLQDRQRGRTPRWRGITLLTEMRARGIPISFGGDNCRDPFHPYGDFDLLEVFRDAVRIGHLEHPIGDWPRAVTTTPGALLARAQAIAAGEPADLVLFRARSFNELLARPQADRLLVRDGAFIAADLPDYAELDHLMQQRLS